MTISSGLEQLDDGSEVRRDAVEVLALRKCRNDRQATGEGTENFMSAIKEEAIRLIRSLPDDCSLEDIQYHLYVRQKIENGLAAVEAGRVASQQETERRVDEWVKSTGPNPPSTISETL
jgi:predicted transcriptional regulator